MALELNDLLLKCDIDPSTVMVMRHRPTEKALRKALPWLAAERPDVYNAYQCGHSEVVENSLAKKEWLASFIGHAPGRALFVGLYRIAGQRRITAATFRRNPLNMELYEIGSYGPQSHRRPLWFDLQLSRLLSEYKGRLVVGWPGIERSWWRRAERNVFPVDAIAQESLLVTRLPEWSSLVVPWRELKLMPSSWKAAIAQWRGVYYIFDTKSGKGYVGSACGGDNILSRWSGYSATGHGGNKLLREVDADGLEFSVLQLLAHDAEPGEVLKLESSWKERLHSRQPHGLNSN